MIRAIVYTSNTGSTAAYAKLLGEQINLPVVPLPQAKDRVPSGSEII